MHELHRAVQFDNQDDFTAKLKKFVRFDPAHLDNFDTRVLAMPFVRRVLPDLTAAIETKFNDVINMARLFYTPPTKTLTIHTDVRENRDQVYALNWPLYNVDQSFMAWYTGTAGQAYEHPDYGMLNHYDPAGCLEVDRAVITVPTVVRIDVPHAVINNHATAPRVIISFRFENDLRGWQ